MSNGDVRKTAPIEGNEKVGAATIANVLGVTNARVNAMVSDGVLHPEGKPRQYTLNKTVQEYIEYKVGQASPKTPNNKALAARREKAEAEYKEAKAEKEKLALAELEGRMHRSEDVEHVLSNLVYYIRGALMALPGRVAVDIANVDSAAEASAMLRREVDGVLMELSEYGYDPDEFAKLVRERAGWETDGDDSGETDSKSP